jgi:hypothetical protein
LIKLTDPFLIPAKNGDLDVVHAFDEVVNLTLDQPTDPVNPFQELKDPPQGWPLRTCSETPSVFIIRPTAQRYGVLVIISWVIVAFDTPLKMAGLFACLLVPRGACGTDLKIGWLRPLL